jgi:hypothetical protein
MHSLGDPSRNSMQLTVVAKHGGKWRAEALMNARRVTVERQMFLDDVELLPADGQRQGERFGRLSQDASIRCSVST